MGTLHFSIWQCTKGTTCSKRKNYNYKIPKPGEGSPYRAIAKFHWKLFLPKKMIVFMTIYCNFVVFLVISHFYIQPSIVVGCLTLFSLFYIVNCWFWVFLFILLLPTIYNTYCENQLKRKTSENWEFFLKSETRKSLWVRRN